MDRRHTVPLILNHSYTRPLPAADRADTRQSTGKQQETRRLRHRLGDHVRVGDQTTAARQVVGQIVERERVVWVVIDIEAVAGDVGNVAPAEQQPLQRIYVKRTGAGVAVIRFNWLPRSISSRSQ